MVVKEAVRAMTLHAHYLFNVYADSDHDAACLRRSSAGSVATAAAPVFRRCCASFRSARIGREVRDVFGLLSGAVGSVAEVQRASGRERARDSLEEDGSPADQLGRVRVRTTRCPSSKICSMISSKRPSRSYSRYALYSIKAYLASSIESCDAV